MTKKISIILVLFFSLYILFSPFFSAHAASAVVLHNFSGTTTGGGTPYGSLIQDGTKFYGMSNAGGTSGFGTIFSINTDGSGFALLHSFVGGISDGKFPEGSLVQNGTKLYGMTSAGGTSGFGTIFSINTDGSGFALLHSFVGGASDGKTPDGSLILSGSVLYGMTNVGGNNYGTIFSINTDGSGFALIHSFATGGSEGGYPYGDLLLDGTTLYGMTQGWGSDGYGTIFSVSVSGSDFSVLHNFAGGTGDGASPYGSLTLDSLKLYGLTYNGGSSDVGTIFSMNTDGSGFSVLHSFTGGTGDGSYPYYSSLLVNNSILYGMTQYGGSGNSGVLFSIGTNGSGYSILHNFAGDSTDGGWPYGSLILDSSTLYGMTSSGGSSDYGTIFSYTIEGAPTPTPTPTPQASQTPDGASGGLTGPSSFVCGYPVPVSAPDLFQINVTSTTATLYYAPALMPLDRYYIAYGKNLIAEEHGFEYNQGYSGGVLSIKINHLSPNTTYYFKVRAGNGCMPGPWSKIMKIKTTRSNPAKKIYYKLF